MCCLQVAVAQQPILHTQFYGIEEGLSHRDVQCIHQDSQGFMWIGTNYGLNRFDGYNFKWYTKEKHGLQSNMINHIVEDDEGWMWLFFTTNRLFQTPISIDLFNPLTEEVLSFEEKFGNNLPFDFKDISSFTASEEGRIAFVTNNNKFILYTSKKGFEVFDLEIHTFTLSCFSKHNTVWGNFSKRDTFKREVPMEIGLVRDSVLKDIVVEIDLEGKLLNRFEHDYLFQKNFIAGVDQSDNLWYISKTAENNRTRGAGFQKGKIFKIDATGKETEFSLNQTALTPDSVDLDISVHANSYGFWINPNQHSFWLWSIISLQVFHPKSGWHQELSSTDKWLRYTNTVYFDNKDRTWVGTEFGLYVIEHTPSPFQKIGHNELEIEFQPFRGITEDPQNNFWASCDRGAPVVYYFKRKNNQYESEYIGKEWNFGYKYGIYTDKTGFIWCATGEDKLIIKYDIKSEIAQFIPYSILGKEVNRQVNIWSFHQDKNGLIWFGTDVGLVGYINDNQVVVLLPELEGVGNQGGCIYQFLKDKNGITWVATDQGLFLLDTEKKEVGRYKPDPNHKDFPFMKEGIFHIHEDLDGSFWMGTRGLGLIHWHPETGDYEQFTKADGLSNNTIYAVYEDDFENLWMTSDYGIIQINKNTHRTTAYLEKDGITHNEFNRISHYKSKDGTLLFGGLNGITVFHPKDLVADSVSASIPLVLTDFQQFEGSQNQLIDKTKELQESKTITLAPDDRFFRLEFALLAFNNLENVQYAYIVEGTDKDWNYQKENSIRFSRLPYGKHTLRIKGQTANGQWSNSELAIKVLVLKPFYLQTWFLLAFFFILFAGIFLFFKWRTAQLIKQKSELEREVINRTKTIRQQAEELKSLERLKSRFFANVSHELRTPLTLLLGPVNTLLKRKDATNKDWQLLQFIKRNGNQLLNLINEILDLSKLESGKLEIKEEPIHFHAYLKNLLAQFHSYAASIGVELSINYKADKTLHLLLDREKVEKIIQNYLSNALKFTPPKGKVRLLIKETDNHICVSVKDSGEGIHPSDLPHIFDRFYQSKHAEGTAKGGTGIGLSLCRELAELLGGKVWVESEIRKGSSFYFEFPRRIASYELWDASSEEKEMEALENNSVLSQIVSSKHSKSPGKQLTTGNSQLTTILLVEDNSDLRDYIKILLPEYNVLTAENGKVALELLNSQPATRNPQLIVSDLMMPVMDGFQFLEKVKSDDRWRHIPVIMLTAKVNVKARLKALRIGVDDYLIKPFEEEELKARIENLLKNYRERMSLFAANEKIEDETEISEKPVIAQVDAEWLEEIESIFSKNLSDSKLKMDLVAFKLHLSQRQVSRRLKRLTGLSPNLYLREMRLQQAREYLLHGKYTTVKETSYAVGFRSTKYFSLQFHERFGRTPSDYSH